MIALPLASPASPEATTAATEAAYAAPVSVVAALPPAATWRPPAAAAAMPASAAFEPCIDAKITDQTRTYALSWTKWAAGLPGTVTYADLHAKAATYFSKLEPSTFERTRRTPSPSQPTIACRTWLRKP